MHDAGANCDTQEETDDAQKEKKAAIGATARCYESRAIL